METIEEVSLKRGKTLELVFNVEFNPSPKYEPYHPFMKAQVDKIPRWEFAVYLAEDGVVQKEKVSAFYIDQDLMASPEVGVLWSEKLKEIGEHFGISP